MVSGSRHFHGMDLEELHSLARSGDFSEALAACAQVEGSASDLLEARCIKAWCLSRLDRNQEAFDANNVVVVLRASYATVTNRNQP